MFTTIREHVALHHALMRCIWSNTNDCIYLLPDQDFCRSHPCMNHGTCRNQAGTYQCDCAVGFTGDFCQSRECYIVVSCKSVMLESICHIGIDPIAAVTTVKLIKLSYPICYVKFRLTCPMHCVLLHTVCLYIPPGCSMNLLMNGGTILL